MPVLELPSVGPVAFGRMLRDGVLHPVSPGAAAFADLPVTPGDRLGLAAGAIPRTGVLSGVAALWVRGLAPRPETLSVIVPRGSRRTKPGRHPTGWWAVVHNSDYLPRAELVAGRRVATVECAAGDALRWDDLGRAIPAAIHALGACGARPINDYINAMDPRGAGTARARSAWAAIRGCVLSQ